MADRHDDLDPWTGGHVEPLPPPPGTFELIKRRARRRKLRRLAVTAGAAVAIAAAAVTVPQVVNLQPGPPAAESPAGHSSPVPSGPAAGNGTRTGPGGPAGSASAPGTPPGGPVPAGFRPSSVTFIGTRTGWVIGQAGTPGHCATRYCTSMARTDDAGKTWTGVPAPLAGPPAGPAGVSQVRFLNAADGWAFGPQLFATHDGGRGWTAVDTRGLRVTGLETVGNRAFGIFASCSGGGPAFGTRCTSFTLFSAAAPGDSWAPVGTTTTGLTGAAASLALTGTRGYLLGPGGMLYAGPVDGSAAWQPVKAIPCPVGQPLAHGQPTGALLATVTAAKLVLACTSSNTPGDQQAKQVFMSADGGTSWQQAAAAPATGLVTSVAAGPAGTVVLGTSRGIDVRPAGSTAWQQAALGRPMPAGGFGYVGMTTDEQGVALPADPAAGTVWFTFDGGLAWQSARV